MRSLLFGFTLRSCRASLVDWGLHSSSHPASMGTLPRPTLVTVLPTTTSRCRRTTLRSSSSTTSNSRTEDTKDDENEQLSAVATFLQQDDPTVRIQIHPHRHGYRLFPFGWDELQAIVMGPENQRDLSLLCRSVPVQYKYEVYKLYLHKHWQSTHDHILCSKLGVPSVEVEDENDEASSSTLLTKTKRRRAISLDDLPADFPQRSLLPNDFPYYVTPPIEHWVLWILGRPCHDSDVTWAKEQLQTHHDMQEFIHWINPPHLQSIPDIDHVHILCLSSERSAA